MAQVFGQPASNATASTILGSPSLNALPSPPTPQTVPYDNLKVQYERLLWASYQVRKEETDSQRLQELEQCISFAERVCSELGLKKDEVVAPGPPAMQQKPPSTSVAPAMGPPRSGGPPPPPQAGGGPVPQGPLPPAPISGQPG